MAQTLLKIKSLGKVFYNVHFHILENYVVDFFYSIISGFYDVMGPIKSQTLFFNQLIAEASHLKHAENKENESITNKVSNARTQWPLNSMSVKKEKREKKMCSEIRL